MAFSQTNCPVYRACVTEQTAAHRLYDADGEPTRDRPWIIRTYAGHSSPKASNALYRKNLAAGQTGLSIAFDLPTQCGYSSDDADRRPRDRQGGCADQLP